MLLPVNIHGRNVWMHQHQSKGGRSEKLLQILSHKHGRRQWRTFCLPKREPRGCAPLQKTPPKTDGGGGRAAAWGDFQVQSGRLPNQGKPGSPHLQMLGLYNSGLEIPSIGNDPHHSGGEIGRRCPHHSCLWDLHVGSSIAFSRSSGTGTSPCAQSSAVRFIFT